MGRGILGVVAGFAAWSLLWLAGGTAIRAVFPDAIGEDGGMFATVPLLVVLALSVVLSILAGFITRKVAANDQSNWGLWLGVLLLAVGIAVQVSGWALMPVWYHVAFLVLLVPMSVFGAKLAAK